MGHRGVSGKKREAPRQPHAEQALQPILDARRARRINVAASLARRGWLRLDIDGEDMSGRNLSLIHEVRLA